MIRAACLLLLLFAGPQGPPSGPTVRDLPNGVRIVVQPRQIAPLVAVDVWVRAGSSAEMPGEEGAAHVLEHMLFKGTPTRKPGQIDFAIESLGGLLNAGTVRDSAHVFTTVPIGHLGEALDVIADMVRNPALDETEVAREKAVVLDELARDANDTRRIAVDLAMAGNYWDLPDAHSAAGAPPAVARITRDALASFHKRLYVPANCTVVIVGSVEPDAACKMVEARFANWPAPKDAAPAKPAAGPDAGPRTIDVEPAGRKASPERRVAVAVAFRQPGAPSVEQYLALRLASGLMAFNGFGRAWDALKSQAAENVWSDVVPAQAGPTLVVYAEVKAKDANSAVAAIQDELIRLGREPLSQDDLETARRRVVSRHLADMETLEGEARTLGRFSLLGDPAACLDLNARLGKIDAGALKRMLALPVGSPDPGAAILPLPRGRNDR